MDGTHAQDAAAAANAASAAAAIQRDLRASSSSTTTTNATSFLASAAPAMAGPAMDMSMGMSMPMAMTMPMTMPMAMGMAPAPAPKRQKVEPGASLAAARGNASPPLVSSAFPAANMASSGMSAQAFLPAMQSMPVGLAAANPSLMMMMQRQQQFGGSPAMVASPQVMMMASMAANNAFRANSAMYPASAPQRVPAYQGQPGFPVVMLPGGQAVKRDGPSPVAPQPAAAPRAAVPIAAPVVPPAPPAALFPPGSDVVCWICKQKDELELFTCSAGCGLHAHPKCIGEDMIFTTSAGKTCGSCFLIPQDRPCSDNVQDEGAAAISVRRAVLCMNVETASKVNFDKFGHLASLRLHEIGEIAGYPIKPFAARFVEPNLQRWIREKMARVNASTLQVSSVFELLIGLYSLDKAGIAHGWKQAVIDLVAARKLLPTDYFGWHPVIEGPQVRCSALCAYCQIRNPPELTYCARCHHQLVFPSVFTKFASGLLAAYYADQTGVPLGVKCIDVFMHANVVRAQYKGLKPYDPNGHEWDIFADQMRMVFGLLDVLSGFGSLQLSAELFEPELQLVFNLQHVNQAMLFSDYEVVGKFLQSMRLFGPAIAAQHEALMDSCEHFLLTRQLPNGSWCKNAGTIVDQYKATVACAKALLRPVFQGFGPALPECRRLLHKWAVKHPTMAIQLDRVGKGKVLTNQATVLAATMSRLKKLELFYKRQIVPSGVNALEVLASARLRAIQTNAEPDADDDAGGDVETKPETSNDEIESKPEGKPHHEAEETLRLSLNGNLEIFDGLKFEDGDVIDVTLHDTLDDDQPKDVDVDAAAASNDDEMDETEDDVYDDDEDDENDITETAAPSAEEAASDESMTDRTVDAAVPADNLMSSVDLSLDL